MLASSAIRGLGTEGDARSVFLRQGEEQVRGSKYVVSTLVL